MVNYYKIHKNKLPKKLKYSKPYSKQQLEAMRELGDLFEELKLKIIKLI